MSDSDKKQEARPVFRKLALGASILCIVLGTVLWFALPEAENRYAETLLFVLGYIMAVIAGTGRMPQMPSLPDQPPVRPIFRKMALGISFVCLALALLFTFGDFGQGIWPAIICYVTGYVMSVIGQTGKLPGHK